MQFKDCVPQLYLDIIDNMLIIFQFCNFKENWVVGTVRSTVVQTSNSRFLQVISSFFFFLFFWVINYILIKLILGPLKIQFFIFFFFKGKQVDCIKQTW